MMNNTKSEPAIGRVVAVCASDGGIPKRALSDAEVIISGIRGDLHAHAKHNRPDRAVSLIDMEILSQLVAEGFQLEPGTAGENITVEGLNVQQLPGGTLLQIGDVLIRLEVPRKPCYILDAIDPRLKDDIVGRCGYMASVVKPGLIAPDMPIRVH
jgi:MOSC domain-containing protein YiiM